MRRFHVHISVEDLDASIRFYSSLFAVPPTVRQLDYAKWMLDDPRLNFAISQRGHAPGVNHLGLQTESGEELQRMKAHLEEADAGLVQQTAEACCYARSDKYWVTDPSGIAWETFHTLGSIPVFGEDAPATSASGICCSPVEGIGMATKAACCVPATVASKAAASSCCAG